jgi:hypothetical protein
MDTYPTNPFNTGKYAKLVEGANKFRLFDMVDGWEVWGDKADGGRTVTRYPMAELNDIAKDDRNAAKYFRAYKAWNYKAEKVQILNLTQRSIIEPIIAYTHNDKWGDPVSGLFDLVINRTGEGLDTAYTVQADPKEPFSWKGKEDPTLDLTALYRNEDPFGENN